MIAIYVRGKHKPTYDKTKSGTGDVCVVVNAAKQWVAGKKRDYKLYHKHSGYPGGLKTTNLRTMLEKKPE